MISENISADEYKRLKNRSLIRYFVSLPVTVITSLYLVGSLMESEFMPFGEFFGLIAAAYITVSLLWIFTNTEKRIEREKQVETKKKEKSKKRIATEYSIFILLFILLIAYAL